MPPTAIPHPSTETQPGTPRPAQDWRILVAVFWVTSMVEGLGVSQIFALLPTYLREMGVPDSQRLAFVGIFSALIFVVGMPLVPLWGAWADKYSRKVVIVRSALVEAVVFAAVALAREPWQVALAMLLIGFQLGNTGVMLGGIRDVTPRARMGTTIAHLRDVGGGRLRGRAGAGGHPHRRLRLVAAGRLRSVARCSRSGPRCSSPSARRRSGPEVVPTGRIVDLAFANLRGVLTDRATRRIFTIFGISFVAIQMSRPYIPRPRRGDRRSRAGSRLGDRAGGGDRGARRRARLAARRRHRRPDRLSAGARRRPSPGRASSSFLMPLDAVDRRARPARRRCWARRPPRSAR